jgi:4-amino-4-deoxy-L-arabinose transferase-like glycosyltransferase
MIGNMVLTQPERTAAEPVASPLTGTRVQGTYRLQPFDRKVFAAAVALFALLTVFSAGYGFDRDELYFLDCARHLALSYVDQPVFTPLVARVALTLFGVSVVGLRLFAALAAAATVVCGGALAREFGGGSRAQFLSALGCAVSPALIGADHLMGPTAFDILAWTAFALVVVRIGRSGNLRLWPVAGLVLGLGLTNKHSIGFFALALVVGTIASGGWRLMVNRWFALGAVIAGMFTVPDLWWQAHHGWATIAMTRALNQENGGLRNVPGFILSQTFMASPVLIPVWWRGLRVLRASERPLWRGLAWSYAILLVFFMFTSGAKPYYIAGTYMYLVPAGMVAIEPALASAANRVRRLTLLLGVSLLVTLPLTLPVLPGSDIGFTAAVNPVLTETVGWPQLVAQVDRAWYSLTPAQRSVGVIFTSNYGEDGAINELGRRLGLPEAVGDHNNDWWWGPGQPDAQVVLAVAPGPMDTTSYDLYLHRYFGRVVQVATITNSEHLHNQEYGGHIYICTQPRRPWDQMWPELRHYD